MPKIQILCENICPFLDPRVLHDFEISYRELTEEGLDSHFNAWVSWFVDEKNCGKSEDFMNKRDKEAIIKVIYLFYQRNIKGLWKNIYSKLEGGKDEDEVKQKKVIVARFTKFM